MKKKVFDNQDFFKTINDTLLNNESVSFVIKGHSMHPILKDGQTEVFLKTKDVYKKNDICLFKYKGQYISHRLRKIKNNFYYFRGDHLYQYELVRKEDILAYIFKFKDNGKLVFVDDFKYKIRVKSYLFYKSIFMFLRKIYLVIRHGK